MSTDPADAPAVISVLAVEDSPADLRLLREALNEAGTDKVIELRPASTLAQAEAAVREQEFDCVLLDLGLPDAHGVDSVRRLLAARRWQTVVVLSGDQDDRTAMEALKSGAQDYLIKGRYTGAVVLRVVRRAIERNKQLIELDQERERQYRRATLDPLTGLPNRLHLQDLATHTLAQAHRHGWRFAIGFVDLNGFKPVNDTHGHAVGDALLIRVASILQKAVRESDAVARIGGDEFLVMLAPLLEVEHAHIIIGRIQDAIRSIAEVEGRQIAVSASIGVAFYPDHAPTIEALFDCADQAMYAAKRSKNDRWAVYAPPVAGVKPAEGKGATRDAQA